MSRFVESGMLELLLRISEVESGSASALSSLNNGTGFNRDGGDDVEDELRAH